MIFDDSNIRTIKDHEWEMWTPLAIECYEINCDCCKCSIYKQLEGECLMYLAVSKLLRTVGEPKLKANLNDKYFRNLDACEIAVMDAIIEKGCRTKEEIIKLTGFSNSKTQKNLCHLYIIANTDGCRYGVSQVKFPKFLEYVLKKFGGTKNDNDMAQETGVEKDLYSEINRNIMVHKKRLHQKRKIQIKIGKNY